MSQDATELFINRCASDVPFFAHNILYKKKKTLSPKQALLIEAFRNNPHVAAIWSRQSGKTTTLAIYDVHELCFGRTEKDEPDHTIIFAPILEQTNIIMGRVHQFFNSVPLLKGFVDDQFKHFIRMKNGNTLQAMSASEQSHIRGHSPTKIQIDETQDIQDRIYYDDILPSGAATGAKIQETGTPKGRNHYYRLTRIKEEGLKIIYQHWEECPFIDREYVLRRKARMPRAKFEAEFCNKFLTDTNVAFSTEMLDSIIRIDPVAKVDLTTMSAFYLGGDVAKVDESVLVILGWDGTQLWQVDMRRMSAFESYKQLLEEIVSLCEEYPITYGLIDATAVGEPLVDFIPDNLPIDGEFQSSEAKQTMVDEFMKLGEGDALKGYDPKVQLWLDYDLRQQFYEWERKNLKSGKVRYHHPTGGHDDIVMAVLAACKAYADDHDIVDYGTTIVSSGMNLRPTASALGNNNPSSVLRHENPYR